MQNNNPKVAIRCMTFNHESYIRQCLNGFVIQKTDFPYFALVVDDASTDNEPNILWNFIKNELDSSSVQKGESDDYISVVGKHKTNHNCTFVILFLKYNHYRKKVKRLYLKEWENSVNYIAICEGDDYWTDPLKLKKQIDILDANPDLMMACNRTQLYSEKKKGFIGQNKKIGLENEAKQKKKKHKIPLLKK